MLEKANCNQKHAGVLNKVQQEGRREQKSSHQGSAQESQVYATKSESKMNVAMSTIGSAYIQLPPPNAGEIIMPALQGPPPKRVQHPRQQTEWRPTLASLAEQISRSRREESEERHGAKKAKPDPTSKGTPAKAEEASSGSLQAEGARMLW